MPRIEQTNRFKRAFRKKTNRKQARILKTLALLGEDPKYPGLHSHRVQGTAGVWESYVDQANRVTWEWGDDGQIILRNNCDHDVPSRSP